MFVAFATPTAGTVGTLTQRNLSVGSLQLMQHHCIQVVTKNLVHWQTSALSRKTPRPLLEDSQTLTIRARGA